MSKRRLPRPHDEITVDVEALVEHIEEETDLTIYTEDLMEAPDDYLTTDLPDEEHPSWNMGSSDLWQPENPQWYEQQQYDRVFSVKSSSQDAAEIRLLRMCMRLGYRRVSPVFYSTGRYCVRVIRVEV